MQKEVAIEPDDTMGTLYFNKLFPLGVDGDRRVGQAGEGGQGAQDRQDLSQGEHEDAVQEDGDRLDVPHRSGLQRHPRLQPGSRAPARPRTRARPVKIFDCEKSKGGGNAEPGTVST